MTNSKRTKRAFVSSVTALLLCFMMLLGTTFAWFTDSAVSGSNVITSGNLDIEVQYTLDGVDWDSLDGAEDLFRKGLWEPGHTEVVVLKIENKGSLALKYAANMNIVNEVIGKTKDGADIKLSEILTVSTLIQQAMDKDGVANQVGDITLALAFNGENSVGYQNTTTFNAGNVLGNDEVLEPGAAHYMIVKVDMAETVGNEANHNGTDIPSIEFGINVVATQTPYEYDSFGNDYDKDATYPKVETITLGENPITETLIVKNGDSITVQGPGTIDTSASSAAAIDSYGYTQINDAYIKGGSAANYAVRHLSGSKAVYNNVNIYALGGGIGAAGGASVEFNGGEMSAVYVDTASTSGRYLFYAEGEGSEITINGGKFSWDPKDNQKRAYIYAGAGTTVYVNGGTFGKASTRSGYTDGILGDGTVIITGGTFGFNPSKWVADGYEAVKSDSTWTVIKK